MNIKREALRLILTTPLSNIKIATLVGLATNTVKKYRLIVRKKELDWDDIRKMDDRQIQEIFRKSIPKIPTKRMPDWNHIHSQMLMPDVTLQLLWEEYCLDGPEDAYSYSAFAEYYRRYVVKLDISMRQTHKAGETVFVDFAGRKIAFQPPGVPEQYAEIFVGVLGCSKYTFAYACASQKLPDWIDAHNQMYFNIGGVPSITIPDCLKSAVIKPGPEPKLNRTYREMAVHYGTVIVPARPRRPQDKSPAEIGVQVVTRWIIASLRHRKFYSLQEINDAIAEKLILLNERPFKKLPGCRRELFEQLDKPRLMLLPASVYEPSAVWTSPQKVRSDYHIHADKHYYSVHYQLVGSKVEIRITHSTVEIYSLGKRVATHVRSYVVGGHTTLPEHQPIAHRKYAEQTPEHFISWAKDIGEFTSSFVEYQLNRTPHWLPGVRACSSLVKLGKEYGAERLEAACERANKIGSLTLKSVRSILRRNLDSTDDSRIPVQGQLPFHHNVRGASYYSQEG